MKKKHQIKQSKQTKQTNSAPKRADKPTKQTAAPKKTAAKQVAAKNKPATTKEPSASKKAAPSTKPKAQAAPSIRKYWAKEVNGKGYIYCSDFPNIPMAVETTLEFAKKQAAKFNKLEKTLQTENTSKATTKNPSAPQKSVSKAVPTKPKAQAAPTSPKSGTKADYLVKNGIKVRPVTAKDLQFAQTDYQKKAKCIISIKGHKFFSAKGSLADCKAVVQMTQHQTGGKNGKK